MNNLAVIMSIYKNDSLNYTTESINSILNQTYKEFDLYIIGDGYLESDVKRYLTSLKDERIFFTTRSENKGLAVSLNELLKIVLSKDYEYIARMDADDISLTNRFERQINFLYTNKKTDVIGTWAIEINPDGSEYFRKKMPVTHTECRKFFMKRDCLVHPSVMFRRSYFEKSGFYPIDTFFAEDTIMWLKGFKNNCVFGNLPEYLFKFRVDNNFFKRRRGLQHAKSILNLRLRISSELNFGLKGYIYAYLYAGIKLMPEYILNIIYKIAR